MKKTLSALFILTNLISASLSAQIESGGDIGSESIQKEVATEEDHRFTFKTYGDAIMRARFKKWYFSTHHLEYNTITAEADVAIWGNAECREGLSANFYFNNTRLIWPGNPFFDESDFRTVTVGLGGFSARIPRWLWIGEVRINVDADHFNLSNYANYDFYLWGRYAYNETLGLHGGFIAQTGMKIDHVYPIVGFDWTITEKWKLNAVYPVNISLLYTWNRTWSFALAGRFFDRRQRVGKHEFLPMALWWYRSGGFEVAANYNYRGWLYANLHAGWTFTSKLTVSTRQNTHKRHFDLKSAPYFGAQVNASI